MTHPYCDSRWNIEELLSASEKVSTPYHCLQSKYKINEYVMLFGPRTHGVL
jgi:hypothetical protein